MSYTTPIIKPINELDLKIEGNFSNVYTTTYNNTYSTLNSDSVYADTFRSNRTAKLTTMKEYNDKKKVNSGVRVYKEHFKSMDLTNVKSNEDSNFRKMKRIQLPSSKRILDPDLRPEENIKLSRRIYSTTNRVLSPPGNMSTLINKTDKQQSITNCRKTPNAKVYKSFSIFDEVNDNKVYRRVKGEAEFKQYDLTTQVVALPGGKKRDKFSIKDDQKFLNKRNEAHLLKIMRDYNSSVMCLPNSQTLPYYPALHRFGKQYDRVNMPNKSNPDILSSYKYNCNTEMNKINPRNPLEVEKPFGIPSGVKTGNAVYKMMKPDNIINQFESQIKFT